MRISIALFGLLMCVCLVRADYPPAKAKARAKPVVVQPHVAQPHAVQFTVPYNFSYGFNTFASPFYGYQQPSPVVAVVDTDGVVRLIELRQLRGLQPQLQYPLQLQPLQPMYAPAPTPVPVQPKP